MTLETTPDTTSKSADYEYEYQDRFISDGSTVIYATTDISYPRGK
jgi:hypothetical protein